MSRLHDRIFFGVVLVGALAAQIMTTPPASAIDSQITIWDPNSVNSTFRNDPNMTEVDPDGLTLHVATAINPDDRPCR